MKYVSIFIVLFMMTISGCTAKRYYILTGIDDDEISHRVIGYKTVGIESIGVPDYLKEGRVAKRTKDNRVIYIKNALWAVDISQSLTDTLIFDLQKSFKNSRVVHYPWNGNVDLLIAVNIKRFIAYDDFVYLDAIIRLNKTDKVVSLKTAVDSASEVKIVESMKKAFRKLEHEVIDMLDDIEVLKRR